MQILIINQPTNNRGDEAAHKSFIKQLTLEIPNVIIKVVFFNESENTIEKMKVNLSTVEYINVNPVFSKGVSALIKLALLCRFPLLASIHPVINAFTIHIKKADYIICAPGGISMGSFKNWLHLYLLILSEKFNRLAYFSRSFGPFTEKTLLDKAYFKYSKKVLQNFNYLSIRDSKTIELAEKMLLNFEKSIDSVFLNDVNFGTKDELLFKNIGTSYFVYVPNSLIWHPDYSVGCKKEIDLFFISILKFLLTYDNHSKIVMLPQLFNSSDNDFNYFKYLKEHIMDSRRIIVMNDEYSSDQQQLIISQAKCIIGARYHSVVFGLNNCTKIIALSYEHKIEGLLKMLDISDRMIDIQSLKSKNMNVDVIIGKIKNLLEKDYDTIEVKKKARQIASSSFLSLVTRLEKIGF